MTPVVLRSFDAAWTLFLDGDFRGQGSERVFDVVGAVVSVGGADRLVATLPRAVDIPDWLIDETAAPMKVKEPAQIAQHIGNDLTLRALRDEAVRRLAMQEIGWAGGTSTFFHLPGSLVVGAEMRGEAKLSLGVLLGQDGAMATGTALAEFALRVSYQADIGLGGPRVPRSIAVVGVFREGLTGRLRLDLDDFNLSLPEFDFPDLDLAAVRELVLPSEPFAGFPLLQRLGALTDVRVVPSVLNKDKVRFRFDGTATPPTWAIVDTTDGSLAVFQVSAIRSDNSEVFAVRDIRVRSGDSALAPLITGTLSTEVTFPITDGSRRFGPLTAQWHGVSLTATGSLSTNAADTALRGRLEFEQLKIYPQDDPTAVIAVKGRVLITSSGVSIEQIELVQPYPIVLALYVIDTGAQVLRFLVDLADQAPGAPDFSKLLEVLARIAAAVAKAGVFAATTAADLLGKALAGLARLLEALLKAFAQLAAEAGRKLTIEVRIATDPLEIRQILITARGDLTPHTGRSRISVLGVTAEFPADWRPGLLFDFAGARGAYLVAIGEWTPGANGPRFASLSTDLWLQRPKAPNTDHGVTQSMPDADAGHGERAQSTPEAKPLIEVAASLSEPPSGAPPPSPPPPPSAPSPKREILILAGLTRGEPVFFQRVTTHVGAYPVAGGSVSVVDGPLDFHPLGDNDFKVAVNFERDRLLPLLGMGEPGREGTSSGTSSGTTFLDQLKNSLSQVVWVKSFEFDRPRLENRSVAATVKLGVRAGGLETELPLDLRLDLNSFTMSMKSGSVFPLTSRRIEERALGLVWIVEQADPDERLADKPIEMFTMGFDGSESFLQLNEGTGKGKARMELRFAEASADGRGVVFKVNRFRVSRGGLDLDSVVTDAAVRLNGLGVPFRFTSGGITITNSRVTRAAIAGRGALPPQLVGDADCSIALCFQQDSGGQIVLQSGTVELDKKGDPIVAHGPRFTLTVSDIALDFVRDGGYHFFFLVTGSLQFTPKPGEFESGLLEFFKDVRIDLDKVPLAGDARVLARHIAFQVPIKPKKRFPLFNLFTFELRGIGFHPAAPKFGGDPAINISGQIAFAEIGDIMQPKIDFHGLWIAPPRSGQALPRVRADGLGVDVGLSGTAKIRGTVVAVDERIPTMEGVELTPPDYKTYGFLGDGELYIEGWGSMSASMGFLEIERDARPGDRRKAFFLYLQKDKVAYEIPTPIWTFYLREVGFGFGFRYTLTGIKQAENATSTAQLVKTLDEVSKRQGDLARFSAWAPDPEGDKVTLALRGAFQMYPTTKAWNAKAEETAANPFFFDIVAALRSDMTLLMAARGWLATNYHDFITDKDGLRSKPGYRGYLFISAPRAELLSRVIGDSQGYIGERLNLPGILRKALQSADWSATLYIRPGLLHWELGWPDQLVVRLSDQPKFRVIVRGGMIFRVAEDGLLWGFNLEADAFLAFSGEVGGGSLGVAIEASLTARFVARIIAYLSWRISGTLVYGLVSLDARLSFSVRAWLEIDLGITSFTIRIGFRFSVQFTAVVELALSTEGVGARVQARVAVSVFGCTLSVGVGFTINDGKLQEARSRVQRFLAMGITAETPDPAKTLSAKAGDQQLDSAAAHAIAPHAAPQAPPVQPPSTTNPPPKPPVRRSKLGAEIKSTEFWLVLRRAEVVPEGVSVSGVPADYCYALLVPKESVNETAHGAFYATPNVPPAVGITPWLRAEDVPVHTLFVSVGPTSVWRYRPRSTPTSSGAFVQMDGTTAVPVPAAWNMPVEENNPAPPESRRFRLAHLFDECFLYDAEWRQEGQEWYRATTAWTEPWGREHDPATTLNEPDETARNARRDAHQRDRAAAAARNGPIVEAVYQARSTVLTMFVDQFVTLARTGDRASRTMADVTDLGVVFFGTSEDLEAFAHGLTVGKNGANEAQAGRVEVFNPRAEWFAESDPSFAAPKRAVQPDGIKLSWDLQPFFLAPQDSPARTDPDQFVEHYDVVRTVEGHETQPHRALVKPASTIGGTQAEDGKRAGRVTLVRPDWQFTDDLADLPDKLREALLPTTSDPAKLYDAAVAWATVVGATDEVTLTYTVTPVDIAGTRGLPRSFVVDVKRPQPPIRPAEGELRIVMRRPPTESWTDKVARPGDLDVVLAIKDDAWDTDQPPVQAQAERRYRLILDPEDVVPSGSYGSDAITDRLRGPQSADGLLAPTGDEIRYTFTRENAKAAPVDGDALIELEGDGKTRLRYPVWTLMAGSLDGAPAPLTFEDSPPPPALLDALWRRQDVGGLGGRVAVRFALETIVRITTPGGEVIDLVSRRVPVPVEVRINRAVRINLRDPDERPVVFRPETFEWPVWLAFPPLVPGAVRARAGFALFIVPAPEATLADVVTPAEKPVVLLRDPDRRILTQVEWDAASNWPAASGVEPMHMATVAGFDVHELDVDELAVSDTKPNTELALQQGAWERAQRVARVQLLRDSTAMLVPHDTADLQGWMAHYPSETWRTQPRGSASDNGHGAGADDHAPIRRPWWSSREATLGWPVPVVRRRLLADLDDNLVSTLLADGAPDTLLVRIDWKPDPKLKLKLNESDLLPDLGHVTLPWPEGPGGQQGPIIEVWREFTRDVVTSGGARWARIRRVGSVEHPDLDWPSFFAAHLRAALLCLSWAPPALVDGLFAADPSVLSGLSLEIVGLGWIPEVPWLGIPLITGHEVNLAQTSVPLAFDGPRHAVLDEITTLLAVGVRADGTLYRRYTALIQPARAVEEKDLTGFLAATAPEKDPYGWGVLQSLGLAAAIRLYDGDADDFVKTKDLLDRINVIVHDVLTRYADAGGEIGVPFAEIMLRPGHDRVPGAFDAPQATNAPRAFDGLDTHGLAFAQVSLRPRARAAWRYERLTMRVKTAVKTVAPEPDPTLLERVHGLGLAFIVKPKLLGVEVLRLADQRLVKDEQAVLPFLRVPTRPDPSGANPELTLLVRRPLRAVVPTNPPPELPPIVPHELLELAVVERVTTGHPDPTTGTFVAEKTTERLRTSIVDETTGQSRPLELGDHLELLPSADHFQPIKHPGEGGDAFERFPSVEAPGWAAALGRAGQAADAFSAFRRLLVAANPKLADWPDTAAKIETIVGTYLTWSQRFLDFGEALPSEQAVPAEARVAFAAPQKQTPWRLAAAADGTVSLSFLHNDRWGHVRAYAIRPIGRYQDLMVGAGVLTRAQNEALVTEGPVHPVGHALSVTPRTERLETPVILGSTRREPESKSKTALPGDTDDAWELVVARHPEESLAFSNRALFARLGFEGVALGFVREYVEPKWPRRLAQVIVGPESWPQVQLHPAKPPAMPSWPSQSNDVVTGQLLGAIAEQYPTLWKGAEIYRFRGLPYHYRAAAVAMARGGIVVSPLATAVHANFPRALPAGLRPLEHGAEFASLRALVERPSLAVVLGSDGEPVARLSAPLMAHADLLDLRTLNTWVTWPERPGDPANTPGAMQNDVAWWPDSEVVQSVIRESEGAGGSRIEEEDAEVRLVARLAEDPPSGSQPPEQPVALRARGPWFDAWRGKGTDPATDGNPQVVVKTDVNYRGRRFMLTVDLVLRRDWVGPMWSEPDKVGPDKEIWRGWSDFVDLLREHGFPAPTADLPAAAVKRGIAAWLRIALPRVLRVRIVTPSAAPTVPAGLNAALARVLAVEGHGSAGVDLIARRLATLGSGDWTAEEGDVTQDGANLVFAREVAIPDGIALVGGDWSSSGSSVTLAEPVSGPSLKLPLSALAVRDLPVVITWIVDHASSAQKQAIEAFWARATVLGRTAATAPRGVAVENAAVADGSKSVEEAAYQHTFNVAAERFAVITGARDLLLDVEPTLGLMETWQAIQALADTVDTLVVALDAAVPGWIAAAPAETLATFAARLRGVPQPTTMPPDPNEARDALRRQAGLRALFTLHLPVDVEVAGVSAPVGPPFRLALFDLPTDAERTAIEALSDGLDQVTAAYADGVATTLRRLARRKLLGAAARVRLRAVRAGAGAAARTIALPGLDSSVVHGTDSAEEDTYRSRFHDVAGRFAAITRGRTLTLDCPAGDPQATFDAIQTLASRVDAAAAGLGASVPLWASAGLIGTLADLARRMRAVHAPDAQTTADQLKAAAGLPAMLTVHWPVHVTEPQAVTDLPAPCTFPPTGQPFRVVLVDKPSPEELQAVQHLPGGFSGAAHDHAVAVTEAVNRLAPDVTPDEG